MDAGSARLLYPRLLVSSHFVPFSTIDICDTITIAINNKGYTKGLNCRGYLSCRIHSQISMLRLREINFIEIIKRTHLVETVSEWSRGMIPALGAGGPGFDSQFRP
jgi:hypothetical protein